MSIKSDAVTVTIVHSIKAPTRLASRGEVAFRGSKVLFAFDIPSRTPAERCARCGDKIKPTGDQEHDRMIEFRTEGDERFFADPYCWSRIKVGDDVDI